ncbi:MAG: helix-turn-helix domain-containing protein [Gemmatimonadota bacterium]|jgi:transcriptional regulator with XRE-family HTH domain
MNKRLAERTDPEILAELGRRLAWVRDSVDMNQEAAAARAGLNRTTVSRAERGENPTLLTVVRLLRVYGRLASLDAFIPEPEVSPMALIRGGR